MQVFDLARLRTVTETPVIFKPTARYDEFGSAHNIVINAETGFAYAVGSSSGGKTCGGGFHMIDIALLLILLSRVVSPMPARVLQEPATRTTPSAVIYGGPDREHRGKEICIGANENVLSIADLTDKTQPVALAKGRYPAIAMPTKAGSTNSKSISI